MIEVTVTVNYKNRNYKTNVLANKDMTMEQINVLAKEQVIKQWGA
jgi:hypothetical protein